MNKKEIIYLNRKELARLYHQIENSRDLLMLDLLYFSGCTVNELINIKIKDIDFSKNLIKFPAESTKGNKSRDSQVPKKLIKQIKEYVASEKPAMYLFSSRQSSQITTKRARQLIQGYSQKADLGKINPQIIRYTHIAHALQKGLSLTAIQKQVGMERLRIVQIYEALVPEEEENEYEKFWSNE